jgi:hypothetical protein
VKGAGAVVWSVGLAEMWSGAVGLARWAGAARGGGAAGDAGMGRVVARLLAGGTGAGGAGDGAGAGGWWLAGWGESDRERERKKR